MEERKDKLGASARYDNLKMMIDTTYPVKLEEEKKYREDFWKGFNDNVSKLEELVKNEFVRELNCINLNGAKVLDFTVEYDKENRKSNIKINQWKSSEGKIRKEYRQNPHNPKHCPHYDLAPILGFMDIPVDPLIERFKERYNIDKIIEPDNDCHYNKNAGENI